MSGCPDCQKRSRWSLWIIPAIVIASGLLQLAQCEGEPGAPTGTGVREAFELGCAPHVVTVGPLDVGHTALVSREEL